MINKKKSKIGIKNIFLAVFLVCLIGFTATADRAWSAAKCEFEVSFSNSLSQQPVTGRVFLFVCKTGATEPVSQRQSALWGVDVEKLVPNKSAKLDAQTPGFPVVSLQELPAGDYYVQALLNVYTEFRRSDGHVIWAHMDQWEGQKFTRSPGNFKSRPMQVHLDGKKGYHIRLIMDQVIPPIEMPADTEWVKRIKIKSELLSKFWGHPFYLGAVILLPKGYADHPDVYYPVQYDQGHFGLGAPNGFTTEAPQETDEERAARLRRGDETGYDFYQDWNAADFPRMLLVKFLHPTPYYDDSYAVNSANNGPFGDAIMTELIPYIESHFRIIRQPYARMVSGGSTGGWEALALQVYHPEFFGATWVFYPDPVDFSRYGIVDIYNDENAFTVPGGDWSTQERPFSRTPDGQVRRTLRQMSQYESVLGSKRRSGEQLAIWEATYGPVGDDGYPMPLWDAVTGKIDRTVAGYMRDNGYDLSCYLKTNWPTVGPLLAGKLKFYCGDMDGLYLNLAVYKIQETLEELKNPGYGGSFEYGRPLKGHGWQPMSDGELSRMMAARVQEQTPAQDRPLRWLY